MSDRLDARAVSLVVLLTVIWGGSYTFVKEADVLYVSFERPQGATDSELTEDGVLMRYRGDQLVGATILNAQRRTKSQNQEIAIWS